MVEGGACKGAAWEARQGKWCEVVCRQVGKAYVWWWREAEAGVSGGRTATHEGKKAYVGR